MTGSLAPAVGFCESSIILSKRVVSRDATANITSVTPIISTM